MPRYSCPGSGGVVRGSVPGGGNREGLSTDAGALADWLVLAVKRLLGTVGVEPRGQVICGSFVRSTGVAPGGAHE